MFDFNALFDEFGIEFESDEQVDSFTAIGRDGEKIEFKRADFFDEM